MDATRPRFSLALFVLLLPLAVGLLGCSSEATTTDGGIADHDAASTAEDAGTTADASSAADANALPAAPTIASISQMAGGLHVVWKNNQKDCDKVQGERKSAAEPYKVVFSVPGSADNKHDASGLVAGTEYTYRLRCVKGDAMSDYSAEKAGTP
jgi:hypothetical protein